MRLVISRSTGDHVVDAVPVDIGSGAEKFAVHRSADAGINGAGEWSISHISTGFRIASGNTVFSAIESARKKWAWSSPEQHAAALAKAMKIRVERQNKTLAEVLS